MSSMIYRKSERVFDWFFGLWVVLIAGLGALYLVVVALVAVVIETAWLMDTLNLAHFKIAYADLDQLLLGAVMVTIFLLVLRTARDVEQVKNAVANLSQQDQLR